VTGPSIRFCSGLTDTCSTQPLRYGLVFGGAQGRIPDVSSYQGHPDWNAAKASGIAGAIFKAGEYGPDPDAAYNAQQLNALHIWHALYWFVRNTGCSHEAAQIIAAAHAYGVSVVVNDLEVPEAAGYGACLIPAERHAGLIPVDYTAPGSWPGGAGYGLAPLLQAEYGPVLHPFWRPVVAWQCTDGKYGCVTYIPGIGVDDVSSDLGITRLGTPPAPPRIICFGSRWNRHAKVCRTVRPAVAKWSRARDASQRASDQIDQGLGANNCQRPFRRDVCADLGQLSTTLGQRQRYFAAKVVAALRTYA